MGMNKLSFVLSLGLGLSAMNYATAAPQTGTWLIGNGENAYGGDIINIDAQDNKVFIIFAAGEVPNNTYFLFGTGAINNNNIEVDLVSTKDSSTRRVSGYFDTSVTGVLDFPGIGKRSVYRVKLNDEAKPESMFGLWNFSYLGVNTGIGLARSRLFTSVVKGTANGAGIAMDSTQKFGCEFQVAGDLKGYTVCADTTNPSQLAAFALRRSANEADGIYVVNNSSAQYLGMAKRIGASDGKTPLLLKEGSDSQRILSSSIESFVYNYGAIAKKELSKKE